MGVRDIDLILQRWEDGCQWIAPEAHSGSYAPGAGALALPLALGPGLDCRSYVRSSGTGSSHHWPVGCRLRGGRTGGLDVRAVWGFLPALGEAQQADLKAAVQELPTKSGIELAKWNWKVVRQFVSDRYGIGLSRSSCLNWLHRLGFALKRPKKRLLKAGAAKRVAFVAEYAALWHEAHGCEAKIFFADGAHFRADAELRGKWVLRGEPALVDSSSPRYGEKASYYWAVCLETGQVEWMELDGNSNSGTSAAFLEQLSLEQLREGHTGPLTVIWDNAPAHRGEAVREYLRTPGLGLQLVNLPGYSPDFNADEAVWGLGEGGGHRKPVLGNQSLGTGEGRKLPQRAVQPERRGQAPLPHRPAIKGPRATAGRLARLPESRKCTSHFGFGIEAAQRQKDLLKRSCV